MQNEDVYSYDTAAWYGNLYYSKGMASRRAEEWRGLLLEWQVPREEPSFIWVGIAACTALICA